MTINNSRANSGINQMHTNWLAAYNFVQKNGLKLDRWFTFFVLCLNGFDKIIMHMYYFMNLHLGSKHKGYILPDDLCRIGASFIWTRIQNAEILNSMCF